MIPVKIQCGCGQRYAFDAEPVDGRLTAAVACPVCGTDGTAAANEIIARTLAASPAAAPAPGTRLRTVATAAPAGAASPPPLPTRPTAPLPMRPAPAPAPKAAGEFNLGLGILGALIGAAAGMVAMYVFYQLAGFRFPLLGVGIGVLTGYGARILYKGTDSTLGILSGVIAMIAVVGTLFLIYGTFPLICVISAAVSVSVAYRIAA